MWKKQILLTLAVLVAEDHCYFIKTHCATSVFTSLLMVVKELTNIWNVPVPF